MKSSKKCAHCWLKKILPETTFVYGTKSQKYWLFFKSPFNVFWCPYKTTSYNKSNSKSDLLFHYYSQKREGLFTFKFCFALPQTFVLTDKYDMCLCIYICECVYIKSFRGEVKHIFSCSYFYALTSYLTVAIFISLILINY